MPTPGETKFVELSYNSTGCPVLETRRAVSHNPGVNALPTTDVRNKRVTVLGLGHFGGGVAVSRWLVENGATVLIADQQTAEKLAHPIAQLAGLPIAFHLGDDQLETDFTQADLVVASPAVPPTNQFLLAAKSAGVPVTTEICLFVERCPAKIFGVTGTKGKSTTSTLLGKMLATRFTVWVGGNIGRSLLPDLSRISPSDKVVLELSSFMLDHLAALHWSPNVAVVTMISADHLDWHGSAEHYLNAKRNIVRYQKQTDIAVLNQLDPASWKFANDTAATVVPFGPILDRFELELPGEHNQLNAQAAFAAAATDGVSWAEAQAAIADFRGLEHRLQVVAERDGIKFVNDSIATIPEAAIAALGSFPAGTVIQIVGGSDKKHLPVDELCKALSERAKGIICIGQTAPQLVGALNQLIKNSPPQVESCDNLTNAIASAKRLAVPGDVILLSPGFPSYDQFVNFEQRGALFARLASSQL